MNPITHYILFTLPATLVGMILLKIFARIGVKIWDIQDRRERSPRIFNLLIILLPLLFFVIWFIPFFSYKHMGVPAGNLGVLLTFSPSVIILFYLFVFLRKEMIEIETKARKFEKYEKDQTEIWDLFHDGTLINAQENTPGNLLLTIELEYVREEFDEDFKYFLLELHECSLFEYYPSVWDIEIIKDIKSILKYDLWMTDVEKKNDQIIVYCSNGILKTKYKEYSIFLDTGTKVSKHDLGIKLDEAVEKAINSRENTGNK
jgi:hypothetical protein